MKADLTILFAEDYKKYNISTRGCRDVLEALTPYFWSSVVEEVLQSYRDDLYMSSTRDIDDDNNVGIYVMPRCFSTLENTKKISVKPVINWFIFYYVSLLVPYLNHRLINMDTFYKYFLSMFLLVY